MSENNQNLEPSRYLSEPIKFARSVLWVALAQVFTSLLGIITLPALTQNYATEMYGIWAQVSVTVTLLSPLLTLHFGTAVVRFLAGEEDKNKRRRYLGSMLCCIIIFSCLILFGVVLLSKQLSFFLFDSPEYTTFVILTFVWTFVSALFAFLISYMRARNKIGKLSIINTGIAFAKMIIIVTVANIGLSMEWILISLIVVEIIVVCGILASITKEIGLPYPNFSRLKEFLTFSVPQIPSGILLWIISASDRYFITHFFDLSQTGIYNSSRTIGGLITLFFAPISFVLLPAVSKTWEQGKMADVKNYFEYSTKLFLTLALPATAGLTILSQPLLKVLTTSEYLVGWELVLLIAIGTIFLGIYQINLHIIYLVKKTKWLPLMIIIASIISVVINIALIPVLGIIGAAVSNIASYFVLAAIVSYWARKAVSYSIDLKYMGKIILATLLMSLCLHFLKVDGVIGIILAITVGLIVFCIILIWLRAFSNKDRHLLNQIVCGFIKFKR